MYQIIRRSYGLVLVLIVLLNCSCATIIRGTTHDFSVKSDIPTRITIKGDKDGQEMQVKSPAMVKLKRKQSYTVTVYADGYEDRTFQIHSKYDLGWMMFGDILVAGGIVGLIIDTSNGAAYTLDPKSLNIRFGDQANDVNILDKNSTVVNEHGLYFAQLEEKQK